MISLRDHGILERAELSITGDYTEQRLAAMYQQVTGAVVLGGVAAVEAVAGRVSRLMEVAKVSGGPRAMQALTPTVLGMIGAQPHRVGRVAAPAEVSDGRGRT